MIDNLEDYVMPIVQFLNGAFSLLTTVLLACAAGIAIILAIQSHHAAFSKGSIYFGTLAAFLAVVMFHVALLKLRDWEIVSMERGLNVSSAAYKALFFLFLGEALMTTFGC